jgi:LEA14-like dessication related protein
MRTVLKIVAASAAALALAAAQGGPAGAQQKADVEISVQAKRVVDPGPAGFDLVFHLALRNATAAVQTLVRYDYRVAIDQTEYLQLEVPLGEPIRVEPKSEILIALPVRMTYENLYAAVPGLKGRDEGVCYVTGGMVFQDEKKREKRSPLAFSSEFPIFRGLEVVLAPVEVRALTVGGADLTARVVLRNPNGLTLVVDRIVYKLELIGRTVSEGELGGGAIAPPRGEAVFPVPLLLDFFEMGRVIYDGLEQPPIAYRLAGEATVSSPFGTWRVPFDRSDKAPVVRVEK